jgi:myeloid leukemia factor 1
MQKGREVQDNVFEPSGFGDFGFHRSMMMPSLFGGRDPFDDPFFSDPFDRMWDPRSASSRSTQKYREKGVVIKELDSDDEGTDNFDEKISRSTMEPSIEHPDDDVNGIVLDRLFHYSVFVLTQVFKEPSGQRVSVKDESLRSI